jgi:hypothetical protein
MACDVLSCSLKDRGSEGERAKGLKLKSKNRNAVETIEKENAARRQKGGLVTILENPQKDKDFQRK